MSVFNRPPGCAAAQSPSLRRSGMAAGLVAALAGCHIGLPPSAPGLRGVQVTRVDVAAVQAGLADELRSGLSSAFVALGVGGSGTQLELTVLDASTSAVAVASDQRLARARLSVSLQLLGDRPRSVVLTGQQSYSVQTGDSLGSASARAQAFSQLSEQLAQDAALWLSSAAVGEP